MVRRYAEPVRVGTASRLTPDSLADLEQGIANLAGAGIEITGQFMIGNPGDTPETIERIKKIWNRK